MNRPIESVLVTGATGNVGRHVASQLLGSGVRVRALTRDPKSASLAPGVEVVSGDFSIAHTLHRPLQGIDAVFLVWSDVPAEAAPAVVAAIAKHARRVVFLSSSAIRDDVEQQPDPIGKLHADIERLLEQTGLEWTFLRPGGFATNARWWWAPQIRAGDVVRWPYGAAAWAPIHERDIAAVAVRALTQAGHSGAKRLLTGPEVLTQADQVRMIGEAIGRRLRFEEISPAAGRAQLLALMPPDIVDVLLEGWAKLATAPAPASNTVAEITGAPALTFRQWAHDHAGDFKLASEDRFPDRDGWPEINRTDVGSIIVSEWIVGAPERQRATVDAFTSAWEGEPWPRGLLSANLFASTDGGAVLLYGQWADDEAYDEYVRTLRESRVDQIDRAVPGVERRPAIKYRLYRSGTREGAPTPGCLVAVNVTFDGPDRQRQQQWVDAVFDALEAEPDLPAGGISGHFHISADGVRALNYAEWVSEEAHIQALQGRGGIGSGPKWRRVQTFPGMVSSEVKRYRLRRSLVPPQSEDR